MDQKSMVAKTLSGNFNKLTCICWSRHVIHPACVKTPKTIHTPVSGRQLHKRATSTVTLQIMRYLKGELVLKTQRIAMNTVTDILKLFVLNSSKCGAERYCSPWFTVLSRARFFTHLDMLEAI